MQDTEKPVFASSSLGRRLVRLTGRLLAFGMVVLVIALVAATLGAVPDKATPWLVDVPR